MHKTQTIVINGKIMSFDTPKIMGILNLTPDSFYDGGEHTSLDQILSQVPQMIEDGMEILDVGGYSSRPGADDISPKEEIERVIPVIQKINQTFNHLPISIDTFRSEVAKQAVCAGASIVNDISGGLDDENMLTTIAELQVPYIIMHKKGSPQNMQNNPAYINVVEEVHDFFVERLNVCQRLGIRDVILDPGFGFGKTVEHNYELLKHISSFNIYKKPVMAGFSRKSMINKVLNTTPETALNGTTVLNTIALQKQVNILRVHDVKEAKQAALLSTRTL